MADTLFIDKDWTRPIVSDWLNPVNNHLYRGADLTYATSTGTGSAYILTLPAPSLYQTLTAGDTFTWKAHAISLASCTLTIVGGSSLAPKLLRDSTGNLLIAGAIQIGQTITVVYEGTSFQADTETRSALQMTPGTNFTIIQDPGVVSTTSYAVTTKATTTTAVALGSYNALTIRRNSGWTGATAEIDAPDPGIANYYTNAAFQAKTITAANNPGFTWGIQSSLMSNNVVQGGHTQGDYQNVAINATVIKASLTPTWGLNSNSVERIGTRTGMAAGVGGAFIGDETSLAIVGTDSVHQTVGLSLIAKNADTTSGEKASLWVADWIIGSTDGSGFPTYDATSANWQFGVIAQGCTTTCFFAGGGAGSIGLHVTGDYTDTDIRADSTHANFILQAGTGSSYAVGIDLFAATLSTGIALKLIEGQAINWNHADTSQAVKMVYDVSTNRLNFYNTTVIVGYLDMAGSSHAM